MSTHALYRFFDDSGDLLYVGITMNPAARWKQHQSDKDWWTEVAHITVEPHKDRPAVLEAERLAIITEKPRYNLAHNKADKASSPDTKRLVWICEDCGSAIKDGTGIIELVNDDRHRHAQALKTWSEAEPEPEYVTDEIVIRSAAYYFSRPQPVKWKIHHYACDPNPTADSYWFGVERIRTHRQVLSWTIHLMEKQWFNETDWKRVIASTLSAQDIAA